MVLIPDVRVDDPVYILQLVDIFDWPVTAAAGIVHVHFLNILEDSVGSQRRDFQETQTTATVRRNQVLAIIGQTPAFTLCDNRSVIYLIHLYHSLI